MVDILAGVLAGATFADTRRREPDPARADIGHFFGAIDVARFRPLDAFKADMDDLLRALKDSPRPRARTASTWPASRSGSASRSGDGTASRSLPPW
jgi:LDH2 family malate/lactate/ureidoglycolate dehydrogenase